MSFFIVTSLDTELQLNPVSIGQIIDRAIMDYYDILMLGKSGMGKSMTADKLVIANPSDRDYCGELPSDKVVKQQELALEDISMWLGDMEKHLKRLVQCKSSDRSHNEVNKMYESSNESTKDFQLISNETTKIRILDTPGFFGDFCRSSTAGSEETAKAVATSGLTIMQKVLRIQATMQMNFKRVVYFLPERGPLERSQKALQIELEQMVHYIGKSVFDCMVLVATVSPDVYQHIPPGVIPFSDNDYAKTMKNFQLAVEQVLPKDTTIPDGKPPVVFISMHDTCEDILRKIKDAPVITDRMELKFHYETCVRCGIKAKVLGEGEKKLEVACYVGQDPSQSIPYEESRCHPIIIPKYWKITKVIGGIAHVVTQNRCVGKWRGFNNPDDEVCIDCGEVPGIHGCKKVDTKYRHEGKIWSVDHDLALSEQENNHDSDIAHNI